MPNQSLSSLPYGNFKVLNKDGNLIFLCGKKKINWYVSKGLAYFIKEDTIQLNFETKGPGYLYEDSFYLNEKENKCVVCGTQENLTRHHVVPYCYRKHLEDNYKSKCYYDILILCSPCHIKYEKYVQNFREKICKKYDVPLDGYPSIHDPLLKKVKKFSRIYRLHKDKISSARLSEVKEVLFYYFGKSQISEEELLESESLDSLVSRHITHGKLVVSKLNSIEEKDEFFKMWRNDFVKEMQPKHLPDGWTVNRNLLKERMDSRKWEQGQKA